MNNYPEGIYSYLVKSWASDGNGETEPEELCVIHYCDKRDIDLDRAKSDEGILSTLREYLARHGKAFLTELDVFLIVPQIGLQVPA